MLQERHRAQVGIGTLIVFIAMILVATITAGVLVETAGLLQSQTEVTGEESSSQVSDRVQVINAVGTVSGDRIEYINLTVAKATGSDDVALENATIQYVDTKQTVNLVHEDRQQGSASVGTFSTRGVADDDGSLADGVLNDPDDRAIIEINMTTDSFSSQLEESESASLSITARGGGETRVTLSVPQSLSQSDTVSL
ncbi:MAG: archaellin/type IV pilin N-terminal domain-containing protein [Haloarculaceae archaeon]